MSHENALLLDSLYGHEVAIERDSRIGFALLLRELALAGVDGPEAPRAPQHG
jgi:hypothetical protein